jgi:hypothetical protein
MRTDQLLVPLLPLLQSVSLVIGFAFAVVAVAICCTALVLLKPLAA